MSLYAKSKRLFGKLHRNSLQFFKNDKTSKLTKYERQPRSQGFLGGFADEGEKKALVQAGHVIENCQYLGNFIMRCAVI